MNFPDPHATIGVKAPFDQVFSTQQAVDAVAASAGRALVVFSGGARADETVLTRTREAMDAGATGVIYGRNIWQRDHDESLRFAERLKNILTRYTSRPEAAS